MSATTALESARSNRSVREQKSDALLVVPRVILKRPCLEDIARRRDVFRSLPDPLGSFPVVCRVASDDMSNSRERKMIAHHHGLIGRDATRSRMALRDLIACAGS